jgi:hypothetical protein
MEGAWKMGLLNVGNIRKGGGIPGGPVAGL